MSYQLCEGMLIFKAHGKKMFTLIKKKKLTFDEEFKIFKHRYQATNYYFKHPTTNQPKILFV